MRLLTLLAALTSLLFGSIAEAASTANWVPRMERVAHCSWDRPGHNPFMGDVVTAIDRYIDIPTLVRVRLKQRMQAHQYDDLVDIRRDEISGRQRYEPAIRDMHFGLDRVCRNVTRERWTAKMHERGLVYCEQGHCILVPTVCRNVSRIERRPSIVAGATSDGPSEAAPTSLSSISEAVAGAVGDTGIDPVDTRPFGQEPWPGWPMTSGNWGGDGDRVDGDDGGIGGPPGGTKTLPVGGVEGLFPNGGLPLDGVGGGVASSGGQGSGGGGGAPFAAVPEPGTWACLCIGGLLLALVSARRQRRLRARPH